MPRKPDPSKQRRWLDLVQQWRRSGLTVRAFCGRHRLCEQSFYSWRRALLQRGVLVDKHISSEPASTPAFIQLTVDPRPAAEPSSTIDVVLPQGSVVRVRSRFDPDLLRQVLAVLQERPC